MATALMYKRADSQGILLVQVISKLGFGKESVVTAEAGKNNTAGNKVPREHTKEANVVTKVQVSIVTVPAIIHTKVNGKTRFKNMLSATFHLRIILIPYAF